MDTPTVKKVVTTFAAVAVVAAAADAATVAAMAINRTKLGRTKPDTRATTLYTTAPPVTSAPNRTHRPTVRRVSRRRTPNARRRSRSTRLHVPRHRFTPR
jgi:hypothetical protein